MKLKRIVGLLIRYFRNQLLPLPSQGTGRFKIISRSVRLRIERQPSSNLILHGNVLLRSDLGGRGEVFIRLGSGATLEIGGEFVLGPDVTIIVQENAKLIIGGRNKTSGSGITSDSKIMVCKEMHIGSDCIIAWSVFLTDSDWHAIAGQSDSAPVIIGDHVWIACGATILKGTRIGCGSIVASSSVLTGKEYQSNSLIGGNPGRVIRTDINWNRDLPTDLAI